MIKILFLVPYPELREVVDFVLFQYFKQRKFHVEVKVVSAYDSFDYSNVQYDVIIARGYTARKISSEIHSVPVIALPVTPYDIIRAILDCRELYKPKKIAIYGFSEQIYEVENICKALAIDAKIYSPVKHEELDALVKESKKDGCDAFIGGYSVRILTERHNLPSVIVKTGEMAVLQSLKEALSTVDRIRTERLVSEMYKTIIHSAKDGLLYVNDEGIIQVSNSEVCKMSGLTQLENKPLRQTIPYFCELFRAVTVTGKEQDGKIFTIPETKITVSVSCSPVVVKEKILGVVFYVSNITSIQSLEGQIRKKLGQNGLTAKYTNADIVYKSEIMKNTIKTADRFAVSDANIIIIGETGTGKELFAQSVHNNSERKNGPFVAINCAALPENLLESELFGYVEGAFTGSLKGGKMGLVEQSHKGTLFLDEIAEISASMQSKLLRVLQEKQVRRIGDSKTIDIDVRIISASNKSLVKLADEGLFRRDLMYRLDVLRLFLPSLRNRERDVELLFSHILKKKCKESGMDIPCFDKNVLEILKGYPFVGNVRELENVVERVAVLSVNNTITEELLAEALYPPDIGDLNDGSYQYNANIFDFNDKEKKIKHALNLCDGNQTKAAKMLGVDRTTIWRYLQRENEK